MNAAIAHRGPDDTGVHISSGWSSGANRLAIIDLSSAGHQPMQTEDGRYVIALNGEIYNFQDIRKDLEARGYRFRSRTDTEVVLQAFREWGPNCLSRLNGMFSFAVLDTQTHELFLARDRLGIKPLYYYDDGVRFIFSSEIKAILKHDIPRELDKNAVNLYFRMLYVPAPKTAFVGISKLPPGHFMRITGTQRHIEKYWELGNEPLITDRAYLQDEISRLLHDSVRLQNISDRPVGVFLSGGVDSTIITGIMSRLSDKVRTFSVGFEQTPESEKYNNDATIARQTAAHFGTEHHEYYLNARDIERVLPETIFSMDEPVSNHVQGVNLLLARAVRNEATVVLGGDGADELFGGYERYYYNQIIDTIHRLPRFVRENNLVDFMCTKFGKENFLRQLRSTAGESRYLSFFAQREELVASFLKPAWNDVAVTPTTYRDLYFSDVNASDFTRQFMRTDLKSWLPDESLVRSDKMSMAASIEQRVPFLDHRLVELADRIPTSYKVGAKGLHAFSVGKGYRGKRILKEAMAPYLPPFVLNQPKWGWFSPAAKWLRGDLNTFAREVLSPSYCVGTSGMFDFDNINRMFEDHVSGKRYNLPALWSILTFQIWYRRYFEEKM